MKLNNQENITLEWPKMHNLQKWNITIFPGDTPCIPIDGRGASRLGLCSSPDTTELGKFVSENQIYVTV